MNRRVISRIALAVVVTVTVLAPLTFVSAASAADNVVIRKVDTTNGKQVQLTILPPASTGSNSPIKISDNGKTVTGAQTQTALDANLPVNLVLVFDGSLRMSKSRSSVVKVRV
jgi:protein-disulfide isomerase